VLSTDKPGSSIDLEVVEALHRTLDRDVEAALVKLCFRAHGEDDEGLHRDLPIDGPPAALARARTQLAKSFALVTLNGT
jgi:hypothetical protein